MRWPWSKQPSYVCRTCGKVHKGEPRALGHALPDVIWALGDAARQEHLAWSTDLATYEGKWYLRGVLRVPLAERPGTFDFGVWVEVDEETIAWFRANWDVDLSNEPSRPGILANAMMTYPDTRGLQVAIQFGPSDQRPTFRLVDGQSHELTKEASDGMSEARYHDILVATGN